jgi:hypothetical protein
MTIKAITMSIERPQAAMFATFPTEPFVCIF